MRTLDPIALLELESQPFQLVVSATLDADPRAVFEELRDMSLWFPLMYKSLWKTGATSGVGAEREVRVHTFGTFRERMLAWDTGERVAFTMLETNSPLIDRMAEDWWVVDDVAGTRLTWKVYATPSKLARPVSSALRLVLKTIFARAVKNLQKRAGTYRARNAS
jgi:hypothetical protein